MTTNRLGRIRSVDNTIRYDRRVYSRLKSWVCSA